MNTIVVDGFTINYIIRRTTKKKIYIRVKEDIVFISVTKKTSLKEIEKLIVKHIDFIKKELVNHKKDDIIHLNGVGYNPIFNVEKCNKVEICDDNIIITSKKDDLKAYQKVLREFYKEEVLKVLDNIIDEAKNDFKEIIFPEISVSYLKSMFGNYNRKKHHIKISSMLAKYDYNYIKLVLYHELSHVGNMNHSQRFYHHFDDKLPNAKQLQKELKAVKYRDCI